MAEPLRHRQTKEADNRYVPPKATAPHLDSTITDKALSAHNESALPLKADVRADIILRRFWPGSEQKIAGTAATMVCRQSISALP